MWRATPHILLQYGPARTAADKWAKANPRVKIRDLLATVQYPLYTECGTVLGCHCAARWLHDTPLTHVPPTSACVCVAGLPLQTEFEELQWKREQNKRYREKSMCTCWCCGLHATHRSGLRPSHYHESACAPACAAGLTGVFTDTVLGAVGAAIGGGIAGLWRKKRKGRKY